MKKLFLFIFLFMLTGCTFGTVQFQNEYTVDGNLVQTVSGLPYDGRNAFIIDSIAELNAFIEDYGEQQNLFTNYDEDYFINNFLILIPFEETSGSIRPKVTALSLSDDNLTITIQRLIPNECTDDLAYWIHIIELPSDSYECSEVELNIIDTRVGKIES